MENKSLRTIELSFAFEKKKILDKITLSVESGSILGLAGPNGAGKSTLLKCLSRLYKASAGQIVLGETDICQLSARQFARSVAYVPQFHELMRDLTVWEYVCLGRNPHQKWWQWQGNEADLAKIEHALCLTSLSEYRHSYLSELSGGAKQRAALAMAIAQEPQFLLLDEPQAHLDFRHQAELYEILFDLRNAGLGCLIVLHDLNALAEVCDRVALLVPKDNQGSQLAGLGNAEDVLNTDLLSSVFGIPIRSLPDDTSGRRIFIAVGLRKTC